MNFFFFQSDLFRTFKMVTLKRSGLNLLKQKMKNMTLEPNFINSYYLYFTIGLYHAPNGVTNPKYKLLHFLTTNFLQIEEGTNFWMG